MKEKVEWHSLHVTARKEITPIPDKGLSSLESSLYGMYDVTDQSANFASISIQIVISVVLLLCFIAFCILLYCSQISYWRVVFVCMCMVFGCVYVCSP